MAVIYSNPGVAHGACTIHTVGVVSPNYVQGQWVRVSELFTVYSLYIIDKTRLLYCLSHIASTNCWCHCFQT